MDASTTFAAAPDAAGVELAVLALDDFERAVRARAERQQHDIAELLHRTCALLQGWKFVRCVHNAAARPPA